MNGRFENALMGNSARVPEVVQRHVFGVQISDDIRGVNRTTDGDNERLSFMVGDTEKHTRMCVRIQLQYMKL